MLRKLDIEEACLIIRVYDDSRVVFHLCDYANLQYRVRSFCHLIKLGLHELRYGLLFLHRVVSKMRTYEFDIYLIRMSILIEVAQLLVKLIFVFRCSD